MTKAVRIENADTGTSYKVVVQIWDKHEDGTPDSMASEVELAYPTSMTDPNAVYLTSTRYLVVKEAPA